MIIIKWKIIEHKPIKTLLYSKIRKQNLKKPYIWYIRCKGILKDIFSKKKVRLTCHQIWLGLWHDYFVTNIAARLRIH